MSIYSRGERQKAVNDFKREYCDTLTPSNMNSIKLWKPNSKRDLHLAFSHEWKKVQICMDLWEQDISFFTEFKLKDSILRPDIVAFPNNNIAFIEVRNSETDELSSEKVKKLKESFKFGSDVKWYFVNVGDRFDVKKIL